MCCASGIRVMRFSFSNDVSHPWFLEKVHLSRRFRLVASFAIWVTNDCNFCVLPIDDTRRHTSASTRDRFRSTSPNMSLSLSLSHTLPVHS